MRQYLSIIRNDSVDRILEHMANELGSVEPTVVSWRTYAVVMVKYGYEMQLGNELINTIIYG